MRAIIQQRFIRDIYFSVLVKIHWSSESVHPSQRKLLSSGFGGEYRGVGGIICLSNIAL